MRAFFTFWRITIIDAVKTAYWWIGLVFTIVGLIPLFPATWYGDWGRWLLLTIGLFIICFWSPYKAWKETDDERERLQALIDSKQSNVELTNFDHELEYKIMTKGSQPVIAIRLLGILRNTSIQNHGSLDFFRIEIPTPRGSFIAVSDNPHLGYKFEPNSIYPTRHFIFCGELSEPNLNIQSWEPYVKEANGKIVLAIQGQKIKTYPISIAGEKGFRK